MTSSGKCGYGRRRVKENYMTMQVKKVAGIFDSYEIWASGNCDTEDWTRRRNRTGAKMCLIYSFDI